MVAMSALYATVASFASVAPVAFAICNMSDVFLCQAVVHEMPEVTNPGAYNPYLVAYCL